VEILLAKKDLRLRWAPHVRRTIGYEGFQLDLKVPRLKLPDGKFCFPPWFEELNEDPQQIELLRRVGVTTRNIAKVHRAFYGRRVRGTSPSSVSRLDIDTGKDALKVLEDREYQDQPPIVAISLDGTAVGNTGGTRTVMVVVGVKADGSRWLLDTFIAQHEREQDITPRLRRLVEKGISPDVYWVADSGAGIQAALRKLGARNVGICTTHGVGNATRTLPREIEERFRLKIYGALSPDSPEVALERLDAVEAELRALGHETQANSLRGSKQGMVMTQNLTLKGELRSQLRSTNALVEGQNHTVKENFGKTSNWQDKGGLDQEAGDLMRLRTVAKRALELERHSWRRLADPKALVDLGERLGLGGLDWETIVARLPPSFEVSLTGTPLAEIKEFGTPGAKWLACAPDAIWFGAPEALAKLGVTPGAPVGADELARAMRGEHAVSGERVRTAAEVNVVLGEDDKPKKAKVRGVRNLEWKLTASPDLMRRWRAGTEAQRAELEAAFWDAATAAMERATKTTQPGHGFAAAAFLSRPPPDAPEAESVLRITGFGIGITRGADAKLNSPAQAKTMSAVSRGGEDAAKAVLDRAFEHAATPPDISAHPPEEASPAVLAGVELRVLEKAPRMVGTPDGLAEIAAGEAAAHEELGVACGEASGWWNASRAAAARQIAAARLRDPASAKPDRWFPLTPGRRLLLGEERARELRADAARLVGRASANQAFAKELRDFDGDPLAELGTAVNRVEGLTEAIAARREIDRRELFEAAVARTPDGERPPPEVSVRDSRGRPAKAPVARYRRALGRHATALRRYSSALAPRLAELSPEQLGELVQELGEPWRDLDPDAGFRHARLEERREGELDGLLRTEYLAGRELEAARAAEARGDAAGAFAASSGRREAEARRLRGELARIDGEIDDARQQDRGPEAEHFAARHPEAAVYDAAFVEAQQRELARARQTADIGMDVGL
jgi:hypothetical protein